MSSPFDGYPGHPASSRFLFQSWLRSRSKPCRALLVGPEPHRQSSVGCDHDQARDGTGHATIILRGGPGEYRVSKQSIVGAKSFHAHPHTHTINQSITPLIDPTKAPRAPIVISCRLAVRRTDLFATECSDRGVPITLRLQSAVTMTTMTTQSCPRLPLGPDSPVHARSVARERAGSELACHRRRRRRCHCHCATCRGTMTDREKPSRVNGIYGA